MPTYQYRCKECEHEIEIVQSFTDEPLTECPECGGPLKKVYGNVGISFKGSGFYKTDSRGGSGSKKKSSSDSSKSESTKSETTKSESSKSDSGSSSGDKAPASTSSSD